MKPTPEQRLAIETRDRALVVQAGAGTGKTWVLVQRFMHLLETHPDWPLESIFAITFTEKAAREMRTRLRRAIEERVRQSPDDRRWQAHRLNLDRLSVSTIHSLCARILRENAIAAGIDPRFLVLNEMEAELLKEEAIRETIQALEVEDHPALALLASLRVLDLRGEMVSLLNKRGTLYQLFSDLDEPEALLRRWAAGLEQMRHELWREQGHEYPDLLIRCQEILDVPIIDLTDKLTPAVIAAQAGAKFAIQGNFKDAVNNWQSIKRSGGKDSNWGGSEAKSYLSTQLLKPLQDVAKELIKNGFLIEIDLTDEQAAQHLQLWYQLWQRLERSYGEIKEMQQALDFDDLELLTQRLLNQLPRSARLQGFLDSIHHLMVDEFQDTNLVQQGIVYALAPLEQPREYRDQPGQNRDQPGRLFVVGDAKQSIYRFRQAQVSVFNRTAEQVQAVTGQPALPLSISFRTHDGLVQATNHLFEIIFSPLGEAYAAYEALPGALKAWRDAHPESSAPVEMLLIPVEDQQGEKVNAESSRIWEARWIAQRLHELKHSQLPVWDKHQGRYRPFEYGDAAVLFRATTQLPLYEAEFKSAGLPYLTVSGRGYYDRPEVQDLIALLAALANPADDLNLAASLRSPLFSFSDETLYRLRWHTPAGELAEAPIPYRRALSQPPPTHQPALIERAGAILCELWALTNRVDVWRLLRVALDLTGFEATLALSDGENGRQRSNVHKFLTLVRESGEISVVDFLGRLRDLKSREAREGEALGREPESGAVQLMSIHAAKGLEFSVVILADMGRTKRAGRGTSYLLHDPAFGLVCKVRDEKGEWMKPASYAWGEWLNNRMEDAERKRLLYVACTRSADLLILSGQVGGKDTWMSQALNAWGVAADGPQSERLQMGDFAIQVHRPGGAPEPASATIMESSLAPGLSEIPPLARPVPVLEKPRPITVTGLERLSDQEVYETVEFRPAMWNRERAGETILAPGHLVGNLVHMALADWDCLAYPEGELTRWLESHAHRAGIRPGILADAIRRSAQMLLRLRNHSLYHDIQKASRLYHEIPFTLSTVFRPDKSESGGLQGIIDLLYQAQDGTWHVLDWKTEWTPRDKVVEHADAHLSQMTAYAVAIRRTMNVMPEVGLCFLLPEIFYYRYPGEALERSESDRHIRDQAG